MKKIKILAAVSAVITAVLLLIFLSGLNKPPTTIKTETLVTAARNIPVNTIITAEMLIIKEIPEEAVLAGAFKDQSLIIGKTAKSEILSGEQILEGRLVTTGDSGSGTLAYALTPGMRAITMSVDATTGLAGMLKPRNKIDIIGEFNYQDKDYTTLVMENITILAVDYVLSETGKEASGEDGGYSTITLEVTPEQAMELSMAIYSGNLRTILRSPLDDELKGMEKVTLELIMGS